MTAIPPWLAALVRMDETILARMMRHAPAPIRRRLSEEWFWQAHGGQEEPGPSTGSGVDWRVWLIMAGRGFGKTRVGAEWVLERARRMPEARIALVGQTLDDVAKVMVEGESGLQAAARTGEAVRWSPSRGIVTFPSGALGFAYSGARPGKLRGPQHHFAWCDEIAQWRYGDKAWDNLMLGLRLGDHPRAVATTTPKPSRLLKRIAAAGRTVTTGGRTIENVHLSPDFVGAVTELYAGTRFGRQELEGLLIEEAEGALWTRDLIEKCRLPLHHASHGPPPHQIVGRKGMRRVVVGVDPPASAGGDACGIVVAGLGDDGIGYVLADLSVGRLSPEGWALKVAGAAEAWGAHRVVAEKNNGGEMVASVLRAADVGLPVTLVHASEGKVARAEPVAVLFESGKAKFAGRFPELEDELAGLRYGGGYQGPGRSPDRADAMVWAMTELMVKRRAEPAVRAP